MINIKRLLKTKTIKPKRYWDFGYISRFIQKYRNDIDFLELTMENDDTISEILIKDGKMIHMISGQYQQYCTPVDGVLYSVVDYPCMKVKYVGGNIEMLRCYIDVNHIESFSVSRKRIEK